MATSSSELPNANALLDVKLRKKSAQRKAAFLAECISQDIKIDNKTADEAIERSRNQLKKWWNLASSSVTNESGAAKKRLAMTENGAVTRELQHENVLMSHAGASVRRKHHQSGRVSPSFGYLSSELNDESSDLDQLRLQAIQELANSKGDTTTPDFVSLLARLHTHHLRIDPSEHGSPHNGEWKLISGPSYHECKGSNASGQAMYTLGRMSFDMFRPADCRCAMGRVRNTIQDVSYEMTELPWALRMVRQAHPHIGGIKQYDITTEVFLETADSSEKLGRIPATLLTRGFCMIDARFPDHLSIWFSSGSLLRDQSVSVDVWQNVFEDCSSTAMKLQSRAEMIARRVFLGAESHTDEEGNQHFKLHRPIGGFNKVFVDTIYADDSLRILRGNHGSILVFEREIDNRYIASSA